VTKSRSRAESIGDPHDAARRLVMIVLSTTTGGQTHSSRVEDGSLGLIFFFFSRPLSFFLFFGGLFRTPIGIGGASL